MYILSYAVIDLIKSSFVMPFTLGVLVKGEWVSSASACQFQGFVISVLNIITVLTMSMTAVDRYMANVHLSQYLTFFKKKYICGALAVSWLVSFAVPLSFAISGNDFIFHPGYGICREEVKNDSYLQSSILKIMFAVLPFVAISACYCRAIINMQKTYKTAKLRALTGRLVNAIAWRDEEDATRFFAALILGTVIFWVPTYVCGIVDAFTHQYCLPRSVYLLCTFFLNVSCCAKPLIIAYMDEDFKMEFKRTIQWRKTRRVNDINVEENNKVQNLKRFACEVLPDTRNYRTYNCQIEEKDNFKNDESTV